MKSDLSNAIQREMLTPFQENLVSNEMVLDKVLVNFKRAKIIYFHPFQTS